MNHDFRVDEARHRKTLRAPLLCHDLSPASSYFISVRMSVGGMNFSLVLSSRMASFSPSSALYRFGCYEFEPRTDELRKQGVRIRFDGQPVAILTMLLNRPGELVTREELQKNRYDGVGNRTPLTALLPRHSDNTIPTVNSTYNNSL
jgi:DNA-binding response OmpR family regulator